MIINPYRFGVALPTDIASLIIWLDASDRGSTTDQWDDKSGLGNHFTATSGQFPTFSGGEAIFDGVTSRVYGPNLSALTAGEVFLRVAVDVDPSASVETSGLWGFGSNLIGGQSDHYPYTSGIIYSGWGRDSRVTVGDPTPALTSYRTVNIWTASGDWNYNLDGTSLYSTATNTVGFRTSTVLGYSTSDAGQYLDGNIKAMCVFNAKLSAGDRSDMEAYMAAL